MNTLNKYYIKITFLLTLLISVDLSGICPSGITTIAHFDTAINQDNIESAIQMGLDYIVFDLNVTENDNYGILGKQLSGKIEPVDSLGLSNEKFPANFAPELQKLMTLPLNNLGIVIIINEYSLPSDLYTKTLAEMVNLYNQTKKGNPVLVGTYSSHIALYLKQYFPELPFVSFAKNEAELFNHRKYEPKIYALNIQLATQQLITQLNNESKGVWIFSVNEPAEMERLANEGASGIITKNAEALIKLKERLSKECLNLIN